MVILLVVVCGGAAGYAGRPWSRPTSAARAMMPTSAMRIHDCRVVTADLRSGDWGAGDADHGGEHVIGVDLEFHYGAVEVGEGCGVF